MKCCLVNYKLMSVAKLSGGEWALALLVLAKLKLEIAAVVPMYMIVVFCSCEL